MPIKKRRISAENALGDGQAWYRGQQAGWVEAILALQEMGDPGCKIAARRLQQHFSLDDDGAIVLCDGSAETDKE